MWIGDMINFIVRTKILMPLITAIFLIFILFHVIFRRKVEEFMSEFKKHLRILKYLLSIYVLFSLIIIGAIKDYILYPFDFIFYTQLCGAIILWCLFIFNTILRFSGVKTALSAIPIGFFGATTSYLSCCYLPNYIFYRSKFAGSSHGGHAPLEFFIIDLFILMFYSLFIVGRNLYKKTRGVK
jgi:TM2 domain-containing membrane protein YozV